VYAVAGVRAKAAVAVEHRAGQTMAGLDQKNTTPAAISPRWRVALQRVLRVRCASQRRAVIRVMSARSSRLQARDG